MHRLLVLDDEKNILNALQRLLSDEKEWEVEIYQQGETALQRARVANFDLFLSDYRMPDMDGIEFLKNAKALQPDAARLILSGYADLNVLIDAINQVGIFRFVSKPWDNYEIVTILHQALEHKDMLLENRYLAEQVRQQQCELENRKLAIEKYKGAHPDLFQVNWSEDGAIILEDTENN